MELMTRIQSLRAQFEAESSRLSALRDVQQLRVQFLGKKGPVQDLMSGLRDLAPEARKAAGQQINEFKDFLEAECGLLETFWRRKELDQQLAQEWIDITMPGVLPRRGGLHPLTQALREIVTILTEMGFTPQLGPEVEEEFYNFDALNIPKDHPARDMQDTFYLRPGWVLRTHTSNTQIRVMQSTTPPIRVCCPGRVFRNEDISARSHVQFHQIEGIYIAEGVSFADLLSTLELFLARLVQRTLPVRFRPSYFPFVEPGLECDVGCFLCEGAGCRICKFSGWLEILGAGLIHPKVLEHGGIDPERYTGFAWGMGIERLVMLQRGVRDIRLFTQNQLAFLQPTLV